MRFTAQQPDTLKIFWEWQILVIRHFAAEPVTLSRKSTVPIAKTARNKKLTDVEVELLILEVQKRTPLWDISLPLEEKNRETVRRLWDEVSAELNGEE